jgi:hypothetical protein
MGADGRGGQVAGPTRSIGYHQLCRHSLFVLAPSVMAHSSCRQSYVDPLLISNLSLHPPGVASDSATAHTVCLVF